MPSAEEDEYIIIIGDLIKMILLSELINYDFQECYTDEKLLSLRSIKNIIIDESKSQISNKSDYFCYVRKSVYLMIQKASNNLPSEYKLLIKEGYRPASIQINSFNRIIKEYKENNPHKDDDDIYRSVSQYVAPVTVAGHPTGGAIDITLSKNNEELFLGTRFNDAPDETDNKTYTESNNITVEEKKLRKILSENLSLVGFVNYPPEWWHWSFGDKYWAYINNCAVKYKIIEDKEIGNLTTAST